MICLTNVTFFQKPPENALTIELTVELTKLISPHNFIWQRHSQENEARVYTEGTRLTRNLQKK